MPIKLEVNRELELAGLIPQFFARNELNELLIRWILKPLERFAGNVSLDEQCASVVRDLNNAGRIEEFCNQLASHRPDLRHDLDKIIGAQAARDSIGGNSLFDPFEYLDQFDRTDESAAVDQVLMNYVAPPPIKPIVIGILAERDDEYTYLIRRLNSNVINQIYQQAAWQPEIMSWADTASADYEMRMLAFKKFGDKRSELKSLIARLGPMLAGSASQVELSATNWRSSKRSTS